MTEPSSQLPREEGFAALLLMCARQIRVLAAITLVGTLIALVIAIFAPRWYTAEAQLLPARSSGSRASSLFSGASSIIPLDLLGMGGSGDSGLLVGLLQSRTVADAVITQFDLTKVYQTRAPEDTRKELADHVRISVDRKTSIVLVSVEDRSPQRARDIANALADEANRINNSLEMARAGQERRFLEKRLVEVQRDLAQAEVAFRDFQAKHGVVDISEQTKATVRAIASLRAELTTRQVQLSYLSSFASGDEQNAGRVRREMAELKKQIEKLEQAAPAGLAGNGHNVVTAVGDLPQLGLEYARKLRDLKIQENVFELLTKQYELAKVGEARDTANAQVINRAVLPVKRSWPRYSELLLLGFFVSFGVAFGLARIRDGVQLDPAQRARWRALGEALRRRGGARASDAPPPSRAATG